MDLITDILTNSNTMYTKFISIEDLKLKISLGRVQHVLMGSPPSSGTQDIPEKCLLSLMMMGCPSKHVRPCPMKF
jgi:hypothetical protein